VSALDDRDSAARCACPGCDLAADAPGAHCRFCEEHCPDFGPLGRYERSFAGILAWRAHLVRDAMWENGLDAVALLPVVIVCGSILRGAALFAEDEALRRQFNDTLVEES
jgi:hypothetical protein